MDRLRDLPFVDEWLEYRPRVAVIRLSGVIADSGNRKGGLCHARYAPLIERAFEIRDLREVALVINSPGGAVAQSSLLAHTIRYHAAEKKVPVTAFVEDVAASGGYWLACAADKIYVQPGSLLGSIGVIAAGFGLEDFIKRYDIHRRLYTAGTDKAMLDPFSPEKTRDIKRLKEIQAQLHQQFIGWVRERRGQRLQAPDPSLFEGQIFTGAEAVANGLADGVGDARSVLRDKYGPKVRLMCFEPEKPWVQSLLQAKNGTTTGGVGHDLVEALETRLDWQRFGL